MSLFSDWRRFTSAAALIACCIHTSAQASPVAPASPKAPAAAVTGLVVSRAGDWNGLSWDAVAGATFYVISRASAVAPSQVIARVVANSFVDTAGGDGGPWRYTIVPGYGDGLSKGAASATTSARKPTYVATAQKPQKSIVTKVGAYVGIIDSASTPPAYTGPNQPELDQDMLGYAAQNNIDAFSHLLSIGIDPNARRADGCNALMMAAGSNANAVLALLIARHAELDATNDAHETALFIAARDGNVDAIRALAHAGASVDKANLSGLTPLMAAAENNHAACVAELLRDGADFNAQDAFSNTALILAAKSGSFDSVKELLAIKADPTVRNASGQTAMGAANQANRTDIATMIDQAGGYE
jgi:ankyrin repeat protein